MLHIDPVECLMDDLISIKINKLQPAQHITLRCEVIEGDYVFDSHAHFVASLDGVVDVSNDPSFGGNYTGVIQMGIFSYMIPAKWQKTGLRYFPRNCVDPMKYNLQVCPNMYAMFKFVSISIISILMVMVRMFISKMEKMQYPIFYSWDVDVSGGRKIVQICYIMILIITMKIFISLTLNIRFHGL